MSVGGATWDTAGTLDLGSGNTFNTADATEDAAFLNNQGWWTFTVGAGSVVGLSLSDISLTTLRLYRGATFVSREFVDERDFVSPTTTYLLSADTYHLVVGTDGVGVPTTYQVTYTQTPLTVGPWNSVLRDRTDNKIVISSRGYELQATLNGPEFQPTDWFADWYSQVIDTTRPPGRVSEYGVLEDFGGPPISSAASCIWSHALWGDNGSTGGSWDGICPLLFTGVADVALNPTTVSYSLDAEDTDSPEADSGLAVVAMFSRALYFLPVRDNLEQRGIFNPPNPEAEGYPADAQIEWETPTVELVNVEITGDMETRAPDGTITEGIRVTLRDKVRPGGGGDTWGPWIKGVPGVWDEVTRDGLIDFTYRDGDPVWTQVTGVVSGPDGWEGLADYTTEADADEVAVVGMESAYGGGPGGDSGDSASSAADIALRFTVRSPRYRWIYEGPTFIPPRRIGQRSDGLTHGARRVGSGNTRQSGSRTLGAIL